MIVGLSGSAYTLEPGHEHDFPQSEAIRLISAGFATPVADEKVERAVVATPIERRARKTEKKPHVVSPIGNSGGDRRAN